MISPDVEFTAPTPNFTIVGPSTSSRTITVGAYNSLDNSLYVSSSWGPTLLPKMSPDLVAPGVNVEGIFPMGIGKMSGTSVAAAITSGACALLLQWGIIQKHEINMDLNRVKALLIRGCQRDDDKEYPNEQWGYGRINLMNSLVLLK